MSNGKPLITANQMTMLRIVVLPVPVYLLYGGPTSMLIAMGLLAVAGVTDYLDGMLARKYGSTEFGRFLDPLADKLMVGALFLPLVHRGFLPAWIVALMFAREFLVTDLRTVYTHLKYDMATSELAKIKTNVQVMGGSVILFYLALPESNIPRLVLSIIAAGLILFGVLYKLKKGKIHHRLWVAIVLWGYACLILWLFSARAAAIWIMVPIMLWTVYTGWQYIHGGWSTLRGFLRSNPLAGMSLLLSGAVLPLALVFSLDVAPPLVVLIYLIAMIELTVGGVENFLSLSHAGLHWAERFVKLAILCTALIVLIYFSGERVLPPACRYGLCVTAFVASAFYAAWYAAAYRRRISSGSPTAE
ncbi:MAG: CDP-alcohol phosphatidyltransferase family protein [Candidatus Alcyoniella australis]|nr:CDP-alcohol phosphatidyltransferase family protein [Candidatus Alcyoniella australis]